jgi:hypothetical protein
MKTKIPADVEIVRDGSQISVTTSVDISGVLKQVCRKLHKSGIQIDSLLLESMAHISFKVFSEEMVVGSVSASSSGLVEDVFSLSNVASFQKKSTIIVVSNSSNIYPYNTIKDKNDKTKNDKTSKNVKGETGVQHIHGIPGDPGEWTAQHIQRYISHLFKEQYGVQSVEVSASVPKVKLFSRIKQHLTGPFLDAGFGMDDVKLYLDWVFTDRAPVLDFTVTLGFVFSRAVITQWITSVHGKSPTKTGKDKWSKLAHNARNVV